MEEEVRALREFEESKENAEQKEKRKIREEEEKKKRQEEKQLIIENQKKIRKQDSILELIEQIDPSNKTEENTKIDHLSQTLKDMCDYGNILKKEIEFDKKSSEKEYIYPNEIKDINPSLDQEMFALSLLAQNLETSGIQTVIKKNEENIDEEEETTNLQFIMNGLSYKKKYVLKFDFGEEKNGKILEKGEEYEDFVYKLKQKLSKDYGVKPEEIIVTYPERGSVQIQVIFQSDSFNQLDTNEFENKFRNEVNYPELRNIKSIYTDVIMGACRLSKAQLDYRGNRSSGWGENENRGGKPYYPPLGWIGIGLKVFDKYDNDNTWIGMINCPGEWCVAYHGVGHGQLSDKVKEITGKIYKGSFRPGGGQAHTVCPDKYHEGKPVGDGVYCTPFPNIAEEYAGISEINGKSYKTVLMVRVKPDAIRNCTKCPWAKDDQYWVVNGTTDEIRPYRILYKECEINN